jgi:nucleotide-binding universal stress UspA family protein
MEGAMFRHMLVPIDLSDRNERLLDVSLWLARRGGARVTLLHVVHRIAHASRGELRAFYRRLEERSRRKLEGVARRFTAEGVPVRTVVIIGDPALEIARATVARGVDLVVMGSHKVRPGGRGWGTTSYKAGLACQCPILLVK